MRVIANINALIFFERRDAPAAQKKAALDYITDLVMSTPTADLLKIQGAFCDFRFSPTQHAQHH
jgi:hypothetical protein